MEERAPVTLGVPQPVLLTREQIEDAGAMAARAFLADPGMAYAVHDQGRRAAFLVPLMETVVRYGHRYGEVYTTPGRPEGVAVWLPPPGRSSASYPGLLRCGLLRSVMRTRPWESARMFLLGTHTGLLDLDGYGKSHWYLWLLGVDPARQGQGIGSALIRPVLQQADAARLPCSLETMTERNVRFYQQHGFRVVRQGRCPLGGPMAWAMWREPGE
jgi:ribosomal protein S18 acetylase RimI-like enzyme